VNGFPAPPDPDWRPAYGLVIAHDVLGGAGHGGWLSWIMSGGLEQFYQSLRWPGWEAESAALALDQGISVIPFLWSAEAHQDLAATSRRPVPMRELLGLHGEFHRQLGGSDPGFLGRVS